MSYGPIHGGCGFKREALASDGRRSLEGQPGHRTKIRRHLARAWHQGLAAAPTATWQTRFHLSPRTPCGLCRWLLLAWVSPPLSNAQITRLVLDEEDLPEHGPRPRSLAFAAPSRLACVEILGTRTCPRGTCHKARQSHACINEQGELHQSLWTRLNCLPVAGGLLWVCMGPASLRSPSLNEMWIHATLCGRIGYAVWVPTFASLNPMLGQWISPNGRVASIWSPAVHPVSLFPLAANTRAIVMSVTCFPRR